MSASTTDKFKKVGAGTVTTLASPGKALAATSITVGSTTNYPTDTGIIIAIRTVDTSGVLVAGTYTEWKATVTSATSLAIDAAPVYGSDQVYAAGSTTQVFIPTSAKAHSDLIDGIIIDHNQDGTHKDISWIKPQETWTYASATSITVPSGAMSKYSVGDKIRLKQGGSYKYFYVTAVASTALTISGGTDYTLTSATITDNYYSKSTNPVGFPGSFTISGGRFYMVGKMLVHQFLGTFADQIITFTFAVAYPDTNYSVIGAVRDGSLGSGVVCTVKTKGTTNCVIQINGGWTLGGEAIVIGTL